MSSGPSPEYRAFVEAGIGILMAAIVADGKYTQEEFSWFKNVQHRHPLFRDVPPDAFNPMLRSVKAQLGAGPWKPLVERWAAAIPAQYRVSMFQLAVEVLIIDKEIEGKEPEVIRVLWTALGIPDDEARQMFMSRFEKM